MKCLSPPATKSRPLVRIAGEDASGDPHASPHDRDARRGFGAVGHLNARLRQRGERKGAFVKNCEGGHTLDRREDPGHPRPNLDERLPLRQVPGFKVSTIREVVRGQIAYAEYYRAPAPGPCRPNINPGPGRTKGKSRCTWATVAGNGQDRSTRRRRPPSATRRVLEEDQGRV